MTFIGLGAVVRGGLNYETGVSLEQRWLSGYVTCYTSTRTREPTTMRLSPVLALGVGIDILHLGVGLDKLGELKLFTLTSIKRILFTQSL